MPPPSAAKPVRSSPRKANTSNLAIRETPSKRELRYTSSIEEDEENSLILVPKLPAGSTGTPKQRIRALRPVASNSRLLRRLSDESIRSPEKKSVKGRRREEGSGMGLKYSKDLVRLVGRRSVKIGESLVMEKEADTVLETTELGGQNVEVESEEALAEDVGADHSLWCGDEEEAGVEDKENQEVIQKPEELTVESEDEDDDDPVVARSRRKQAQRRIVDSDTEDEDEEPIAIIKSSSQQVPLRAQSKAIGLEPGPLVSSKPSFQKGNSSISNWAQDVIDLTDSPEPPASFALPELPASRSQPIPSSRPTSSGSIDGHALLHLYVLR